MIYPSPNEQMARQRRIDAEKDRRKRMARAWDYYNGHAPKPLRTVDPKTKRALPHDDNVRVNFAELIVNTGVAYLFGDKLQIDLDGADERNADEQWIDQVLPMRQRMLTFQKLAINGGVTGHTFSRILPPVGMAEPRVVVLDPGIVTPTWDPRDIDTVTRFKIRFEGDDPDTGKPRVYETIIEPNDPKAPTSWSIRDHEGSVDAKELPMVGEETWPHPFAPIVHTQNLPAPNEFWGEPDLDDDILDLITRIDGAWSNMNKILRLWTKPPTFAKNIDETQLAMLTANPDGINLLPGPDAEVITLKAEANLEQALTFKSQLTSALHEVVMLPEIATGKLDNVGQLSSLAMHVLYGPLIQLTRWKRLTYGLHIDQVVRRLLVVSGRSEVEPILTWSPIVPTDPKTQAETAVMDSELGVSKRTLLEQRGFDADKEAERRAAEATNVGAALLDNFADGVDPGE